MRALRIVVCAVAVTGCFSSRDLPSEPEGAAGMSGAPIERVESLEPIATLDPACESLTRLAARDGTITFREDGSAVISVWLENTSDSDVLDYPGLGVYWTIEDRYAGGGGDLLLYGVLARDRYEHVISVPAEEIARGAGGTLVVHAEPFTFASRDSELGCEANSLEFSAPVP